MITHIRVDGFKTLQNVDIPLRPFQAFAGPNNVGKSNLFDALRLLSMLPDHDLPEILQSIRGDPYEIFTQLPDGSFVDRMNLSVDMLLDPHFYDEFEGEIKIKRKWLRYEVEIERDEGESGNRIRIAGEQLLVKRIGDKGEKFPWKRSDQFQKTYLSFARRGPHYISINEQGEMIVHQDGAEHGRPRVMRRGARQSVLNVIRDAGEFPHICAVRNELQRWKFVHLDPEAMREPDAVDGPDKLTSNGRYLSACLHRIMEQDTSLRIEMSNWVRQFIPGAQSVDVRRLDDLHRYLIELRTVDGRVFSSRVLSDGTLRLLALLALQYDPEQNGIIFLEEPENGVHPRRLSTIVSLLRGMTTDPTDTDFEATDPDTLRQVLINTHSPRLVDELTPEDLILVEATTQIPKEETGSTRYTRYRPATTSTWGPMFSGQYDEATRERLRQLLEERDLGELWVSGALGGVP